MSWDSEGQRRLADLISRGRKQREIAAHCRVDQSTVSRWISGQRAPVHFGHRDALSKLGIPHRAWDEPARDENMAA